MGRERRYVHNIPAARRLRRSETESEAVLWEQLRDRRLLGLKFRRQQAIRQYVVDFFCKELSLAIEVDGAIHDDPEVVVRDRERQRHLEWLGVRVLRMPAQLVLADIDDAMQRLMGAIAPLLPRESGEGAGG
jgi:uroporphyrinogen-III synthase